MIVEGKKKAITLHTVKREFKPLQMPLAMRIAQERCTTPKQINPLKSPVSVNSEIARMHERVEQGRRRR